jgi:hypothetical protein
MSARRAARLLAAGRAALGAAVLAAPERVTGRWLGERNARNPVVRDLALSLGARDLALGLVTLFALGDRRLGAGAQAACAMVDAVDALATLAARDELPRDGAVGTVLVAGGAAAGGLYLSRRLLEG